MSKRLPLNELVGGCSLRTVRPKPHPSGLREVRSLCRVHFFFMSTMSATKNGKSPRKVCFVTIGATAGFDSLITASLSTPFLEALRAQSYTDLRLQHGKDGRSILEEHNNISPASTGKQELNISGFDFKKQGLGVEMKAAKGGSDGVEGVVISHAGIPPIAVTHSSLQAHEWNRLWLNTRRPSNHSPPHCRSQSQPA